MDKYKFYFPLQVRYGDLDPQWHVNNAHTVTFIETARLNYIQAIGLFDGKSFFDLGLIVADVHVVYLAPIKLTQKIRVGVRVAKIGTKSLTLEYQIEDETNGSVLTRAETVMVCFDYHKHESKPVPDGWRAKITAFEGWESKNDENPSAH